MTKPTNSPDRSRGRDPQWTPSDQARSAPDERPLLSLIADLELEADREDLPRTLRTRVAIGLERMRELLEAVRAGNDQLVHELVTGTVREDGTKRPDGLSQVLPLWARGSATLDALAGLVVADESQQPVTVTMHWERVPVHLRPAAASLASELVDAYRDRPLGGRPPKSGIGSRTKPGHPDTTRPPA
jgi:hypothetical protein